MFGSQSIRCGSKPEPNFKSPCYAMRVGEAGRAPVDEWHVMESYLCFYLENLPLYGAERHSDHNFGV
jgi:hypothetical protein